MSKVLLVTGASSDIGSALIGRIASDYDIIYAHYNHSQEVIGRLQREIGDKVIPVQADFTVPDEVDQMISDIQKVGYSPDHIVHLSAPKAFNQKFHKLEWTSFQEGLNTSLYSLVEILKAYLPHMIRQKNGRIILMLTSYTLNLPPKYQASYVTVKYSLLGLMKSLAVEYADKGITVNGVSPDMVETKFLSDIPELIIEQNAQKNPLKRNIRIDDILPAIEYLLSDSACAVTGQNLGITGGL